MRDFLLLTKTRESSYSSPRTSVLIASALAAASKLGDFIHFTKLDKLLDRFSLLEVGESLGSADILTLYPLGIAAASDARQNAGGLHSLGEAPKYREIVLTRPLDHLDIYGLYHEANNLTHPPILGNGSR